MINTIERPESGTHFDVMMSADEMGIYSGGRPLWLQMPCPQVGASTFIGFSDVGMLADEMGMYSGGYSLGAKMLFPQVGSSVVRSGVGPAPEHSPTTMLEKAMSHMHLGFFMYPIEPSATTIVLVDDLSEWKQTETGFDSEYQRVIDELRNGGREITADEVVAILRNSQEDPEEPEIKLFSLQSMAHFLVTNEEFDDPIIGPDPSGLMQIEWHIHGNGLLVMAFIEGNEIHFIAQADETSDLPALDESVQLPTNQIVEGYGYLVPSR